MTCERRLCAVILTRISDTCQGLLPYLAVRVQIFCFSSNRTLTNKPSPALRRKLNARIYLLDFIVYGTNSRNGILVANQFASQASAKGNTGTRRLHKRGRASGQHSESKRHFLDNLLRL